MTWQKQSEEASIVLVGNFNPAIYHPEWFISKEIIQPWDYGAGDVTILPDFTEIKLQGGRKLDVLLNQFILKATLAHSHLALKDLVTNTFTILRETPIKQMGMNYSAIIKLQNLDDWIKLGAALAPKAPWEKSVNFLSDLPVEAKAQLGLWEILMNLPRPDKLIGYIRVKLNVVDPKQYRLSMSVNDHVEIEDGLATSMVPILNEYWELSQERSKTIIEKLLESIL